MVDQQQQLVDEAARLLHDALRPSPGQTLRYETSDLVGYTECSVYVDDVDGSRSANVPSAVIDAVHNLRKAMYQQGRGTWYSATLVVVDGHGSVDFNFDREPNWDSRVSPLSYVRDLERYPRDGDHIPDWLAERLEQARTPPATED